ncbi:nuclear transport factor 2 family protein [Streptomyces huiliensis]|uniref:nuclear transport factor 2 family protein n=1 Tax=Streptomyces huiliensis TaxID=2876027 RepID=UPI001CBC4742|nr:nuclear transport factor 2 family protein [Streptomyces huiliensis]MBZ4322090.1 nuclear transport factor 2 family protein [Streptomyces huiliensis]
MSTVTPAPHTDHEAATAATRALVGELLQRMADGDAERIAELYAEGADWALDWPVEELGRVETPWIRERSSRADAAAHYREIGAHHVPEEADTRIERVLVDGVDAVVTGELRLMARPTGRRYRARFALHLTVENGLVTRHHVYEDSLAVARAFTA